MHDVGTFLRTASKATYAQALCAFDSKPRIQYHNCRKPHFAVCFDPALCSREAMFAQLRDRIALPAASQGNLMGFQSRCLRVRPADPDDAWLGLPAPEVPELDAITSTAAASTSMALTASADTLARDGEHDAAVGRVQRMDAAVASGKSLSFR